MKEFDNSAESFVEILDRAKSFLTDVVEGESRGMRIMISAHGALDQALIYHMKKKDKIEKFWEGGLLPNCGIDIIEYDP